MDRRRQRRSQNDEDNDDGKKKEDDDDHDQGEGEAVGRNDDDDDVDNDDEDEASSSEEEVEAAVLSRSKRATAGRRLTSLVGKAAEDDLAFWGHDTWNEEEEGSDNDSFHDSDEDSAHQVDTFDSDFDDSERDDEAEDQAEGEMEDAELAKQERKKRSSRGKRNSHEFAKAARDLLRGVSSSASTHATKRGGGGPHNNSMAIGGAGRIMGDGINAGIALNLPPLSMASDGTPNPLFAAPGVAIINGPLPPDPSTISSSSSLPAGKAPVSKAAAAAVPHIPCTLSSSNANAILPAASAARRPPRRATQHSKYSSRFRAARNHTMDDHPNASSSSFSAVAGGGGGHSHPTDPGSPVHVGSHSTVAAPTTHVSKRKLTAAERAGEKRKTHRTEFSQDELLLESVHTTAPENHRWLLGRKRAADEVESNELKQQQQQKSFWGGSGGGRHYGNDKKLVQRESSKRGTLNVVSFFDMDFVPSIFISNSQQRPTTLSSIDNDDNNDRVCVITGKPAIYRDPKSLLPYRDVHAFRELRQRLQDGRIKPPKPRRRQQQQQPTKKVEENGKKQPAVVLGRQPSQEPNGQHHGTATLSIQGDSGTSVPANAKASRGKGTRNSGSKRSQPNVPVAETTEASASDKTTKTPRRPRKKVAVTKKAAGLRGECEQAIETTQSGANVPLHQQQQQECVDAIQATKTVALPNASTDRAGACSTPSKTSTTMSLNEGSIQSVTPTTTQVSQSHESSTTTTTTKLNA